MAFSSRNCDPILDFHFENVAKNPYLKESVGVDQLNTKDFFVQRIFETFDKLSLILTTIRIHTFKSVSRLHVLVLYLHVIIEFRYVVTEARIQF